MSPQAVMPAVLCVIVDRSNFDAVMCQKAFIGRACRQAAYAWQVAKCDELQAKTQHSGMAMGEPLNHGGDFDANTSDLSWELAL